LTIKLEIDLNYIDITPGNAALFGFNMEEPLIITFNGKETKFLNSEDDAKDLTFSKTWNRGMFDFTCMNGDREDIYGCKDYLRLLFEKFIHDHMEKDY
jgi:hypothetical protein